MKKKLIYILLVSITLFSACSTELDVTGKYQETMVVYGLLDQSQPKQYIKINKAFLGQGNANDFALVKDSTQYANLLSVKLKRLSDGSEYNLSPDNTVPKDPGTFYSPDQASAIYSFNSTPGIINSSSDYKLIIKNSETGNEVTATTSLITDFGNYTSPNILSAFNVIVAGNSNYSYSIKWNSGKNARIYQMTIRFNYVDSTVNGNVPKHLDWVFTEQKTQGLAGGEPMSYDFVGQEFLKFVGSQISDYSDLYRRIPGNVDIVMIAAGDELSTFMEVNKPSTGIIQEKPEYTNITNGLGIFSSRFYKAPYSKPLGNSVGSATLDSLSGGQYTCRLKFLNNVKGSGFWTGCH